MKKQIIQTGFVILYSVLILALPALAIVPPSDEEAEWLRTAPDLQERIDRANSLLEPLLNSETVSPVDVAVAFSGGLERSFGLRAGDEGFYPRYDLNQDNVIDERDFVELVFVNPALTRQACKSPTHGEAHCVVLPIKFPDVGPDGDHHSDYWDNMFFGDGFWTTKSYYTQVSEGQLDLGGAILTNPEETDGYWMADYPKTTYDWDTDLLGEILDKADVYYDFSDFDADGNNEADGVFFIYAGETDDWGDFYWGWATYGGYVVDGVVVGPLMFVGEYLQTWRVAAHEFGHMMGLPDYYDYTFNSKGIGVWAIMGRGSSYHDARSKDKLGWSSPIDVSMDMYDVLFTPRSENGDSYRLWHEGAYGPEYFLVEMVTPTGYDSSLPGGGLLIWHVDDTRSNNNDENHKLLDVEEADGNDDLDHNNNNGDATDVYWWPHATLFNSTTYPNSDSYSGAETAVEVVNVSTVMDMSPDLLVGIISNLDVDEIEPNNVWDDIGVIVVPDPNDDPDGKLNYIDDLQDFWMVPVSEPSVIDVLVDSYQDTVNLNLTLWGPAGSGPIEISSTTQPDEHLRAAAMLPGIYYIEVSVQRGGAYYDLYINQEPLPGPGEIEIKGTPMLDTTVYDDTMTAPAMMIEIFNNAGVPFLTSIQFYSQGDFPSYISGVKLWLDNGDETFGPGLDTLITGPVSIGTTNRFIIDGLGIPVGGYTVLFASIDIIDTGGGGTVGLTVESYKDIEFTNGMVIYPNFPLTSGTATAISAPMPLSYVAAGDFWMGSDPPNDPYYNPACDLNEETPAHWNRTGDYYIGRYEITCGDWMAFMADGGYDTQSYWAAGGWTWKNNNELTQPAYWNDPAYRIGDAWGAYPIGGISWYECMAYCNYAGGRLPLETEWEKAGRGNDGRLYTYGNSYDPSICALGWLPEPVGSYPASDSIYGLTDMCGNIFEWTWTSWAWGLYDRYSDGILDEPGNYHYKMQRGYRFLIVGDCDQDYATRLPYRDTWPRTYRWSVTGLRVAYDPPA